MEHDLGLAPGDEVDDLRVADVDLVEREPVGAVARSARASARLASDPVDRSSSTSTSWPSASRRSTSVEPMNPAPPVTRVFMRALPSNPVRNTFAASRCAPAPDDLAVAHDAAEHATSGRPRPPIAPSPTTDPLDHGAEHHPWHPRQQHRVLDPGAAGDDGAGPDDRALDRGIGGDARRRGGRRRPGRAAEPVEQVELGLEVLAGVPVSIQ